MLHPRFKKHVEFYAADYDTFAKDFSTVTQHALYECCKSCHCTTRGHPRVYLSRHRAHARPTHHEPSGLGPGLPTLILPRPSGLSACLVPAAGFQGADRTGLPEEGMVLLPRLLSAGDAVVVSIGHL